MERFVPRPVTETSRSARIFFVTIAVVLFAGGFALARWSSRSPQESDPLGLPTRETTAPQLTAKTRAATAGPEETAHQSLRSALEGDDPHRCAARVLAWLETTTAETFQQLAAAPEKFPMPYFPGFQEEFQTRFFAEVGKRWLELDPEGAIVAMEKVDQALQKNWPPSKFLVAIAKQQPEMVLEKLPLKSKEGYLAWHTRAALEALTTRDRDAARRFASQLTDKNLRKDVDAAIASNVAKIDPLAAVAMAAKSDDKNLYRQALEAAERIGPGMLRQVLQEGEKGQLGTYAITPELILRHPDLAGEFPDIPGAKGYLNDAAYAAADRLSSEERDRLLASYETLPSGMRDHVVAAAACSWARTEPRKAAEWALAHSKPDDGTHQANTAAQQVFLRWINNDPDQALAWWRALPSSELRDALGTTASTYMAENGQMDAALEMFRPRPDASGSPSTSTQRVSMRGSITITTRTGSIDESAATHLAQFLAKDDPSAAGNWFATLPTSVATEATARVVVEAWYNRDPEALARWIETLPQGGPRDQAARAFIQQASTVSPAGAAEWVETIADRQLREQAALWVLSQWRDDDPASARQWMKNLRGVDPDWQATILRRWK